MNKIPFIIQSKKRRGLLTHFTSHAPKSAAIPWVLRSSDSPSWPAHPPSPRHSRSLQLGSGSCSKTPTSHGQSELRPRSFSGSVRRSIKRAQYAQLSFIRAQSIRLASLLLVKCSGSVQSAPFHSEHSPFGSDIHRRGTVVDSCLKSCPPGRLSSTGSEIEMSWWRQWDLLHTIRPLYGHKGLLGVKTRNEVDSSDVEQKLRISSWDLPFYIWLENTRLIFHRYTHTEKIRSFLHSMSKGTKLMYKLERITLRNKTFSHNRNIREI